MVVGLDSFCSTEPSVSLAPPGIISQGKRDTPRIEIQNRGGLVIQDCAQIWKSIYSPDEKGIG